MDPLIADGIVTLYHGTEITLRLRIAADSLDRATRGAIAGHVSFAASEHVCGANVEVSVNPGELERFGL